MQTNFKKVDNPLTIIAIFAGITEVSSSVALPFLNQDTQYLFVWFLILFPLILIIVFFLTLNFNTPVLYAPGDYKDERNFIKALKLSKDKIKVTSPEDVPQKIKAIEDISTCEMSNFKSITKDELDLVNEAFKYFGEKVKRLFEDKLIDAYTYGYRGEGLFLVTVILNNKQVIGPDDESRIIRVKTLQDGRIELSIVDKELVCFGPRELSEMLFWDLRDSIETRRVAVKSLDDKHNPNQES